MCDNAVFKNDNYTLDDCFCLKYRLSLCPSYLGTLLDTNYIYQKERLGN